MSLALVLLLAASASGETGRVAEWRVRQRLSGLPISFVANAGQTDPAVAYYAQTFSGTVFVTRDGRIVYSLLQKRDSDSPHGRKASASLPKAANANAGWSLTETAVGGRASAAAGCLATANVSSFIANDPACWTSSLPTYEDLSLGEVWPGISLQLKARGNSVEKIFTVEPGGDPSKIRMAVRGARSLTVKESGALVLGTGLGEVTFTPPMAYQESGGARPPVDVAYELRGGDYGFRLGDYDPALPVIIDPLVQSTYLGGGRDDIAVAVAVHPVSGDVYVVGQTTSTNFPGTAGGAQPGAGGGAINAIVARFNPALTALLQATYLGATSDVIANALAIHPTSGDVYVAGQTSALDFPGTAGGAQPSHAEEAIAGSDDGFVAILNPALTALTGATYLGGTRDDVVTALAIHPTSGEVYAAGWTLAMNFPGTFGGAQPGSGGGGPSDAFLARLNPALTTLAQATYLGGSSYDLAFGLGIQPISGDVYVAGLTTSTNFPGTAGGAQPTHAIDTGLDVFAARLNSTLTALVQATYLGGSGDDSALALAVHPTSGDVFVAGRTYSTNFPATPGGAQPESGGGLTDGFVARLNPALTALAQSTYLGGSFSDFVYALAIPPTSGDVYAAGQTFSANFPFTAAGAQPESGGGEDGFVARLSPALTAPPQATYLGGSGADTATSIAIHPASGDVYVGGWTYSTNFPRMAGGAQPAHALDNGSSDVFVARLTSSLAPWGCSADATTLCLNNGRFKVQTQWTTPQGQSGAGQAVGLTSDTGYFWFFSSNNAEIVAKVVDGRALNSRFWVFAGGLTNVNVVMTVTDTLTGAFKTYTNPQGVAFQPIQDTSAFAALD
ncbi:MAG TPA: SBBP repeat-containing protein [Thermoanaerobaculia bacterium]